MYTVHFLNIKTGERRQKDYSLDWYKPNLYDEPGELTSDYFWWTDGNFGCGCNRTLEWYRAGDEKIPDEIWDDNEDGTTNTCSNTHYWVTHVTLPDGKQIKIDGEPK